MNRFSTKVMPVTFFFRLFFLLILLGPAAFGQQRNIRHFLTNFTYDSLGRVATITHPSGHVQAYTYNSLEGHKTVSYDGAPVISNTEYGLGALAESIHFTAYKSLPAATLDLAYDNINRLTSLAVDIGGIRYRARNMTYNA